MITNGCSAISQQQQTKWYYDAKEQSLNAPAPYSQFVHVTQQIQEDYLQYVTCNTNNCPEWQKKTLIKE